MAHDLPRILFAAPASGGGKTTVAMAFLGALARRGLKPSAFKCGPDYIDPMFHREVLGAAGCNLDLFLAAPDVVRGLLARGAAGSGIAVIEGAMGLYDGVGDGAEASAWNVAAETETPVALVVRPRGAFLSLAALVKGFCRFRPDSMIRGIVLNRCKAGSYARYAAMLERETGLRVYGCLPDLPEATLESRRLGLTTPDAVAGLREKIELLAQAAERSLDLDGLVELAGSAPSLRAELPRVEPVCSPPVRVAVADDAAFCFYYAENLALLRALGAEPIRFSPLRDAALPENIGGLYLGGGYPELHAERLEANAAMRGSVREAVRSGLPTLAECGGFLYLQEWLVDGGGVRRAMAGALPGRSRDAGGLRRFGYLTLTATRDTLLCPAGATIPAHEFHHWDSDAPGDACRARKPSGGAEWDCVAATGALFAGFPHLYFWSDPARAERFVRAAARRLDHVRR